MYGYINHEKKIFFRYPNSNLRFAKIQKTLQRIKNGVLPKNPSTVQQINAAFEQPEILQAFGHTFGENGTKDIFFDTAVDTDDFKYCVFSSKKMIRVINEHIPKDKLHLLMDATFRTVSLGPFNQLLIIYVRIKHQVSKQIKQFYLFFSSFSTRFFLSLSLLYQITSQCDLFLFFLSFSFLLFWLFHLFFRIFLSILGVSIRIYSNIEKV